jgi:hypothetical protein
VGLRLRVGPGAPVTRDELTALRARVWRRAFDAGAVAELLRETTNEHARRSDLTAAERGNEDELLGIANDLEALLARAQRYLDTP